MKVNGTLSLISLKIRNNLFFISGLLGKKPESLSHFEKDLEFCANQEGGHGYGPNNSVTAAAENAGANHADCGFDSSQVSKGYSLSKSVLFPLAF